MIVAFLALAGTSVDRVFSGSNLTENLSNPDAPTTSAFASSRPNFVHCEISFGVGDRSPEMPPPTAAAEKVVSPTSTDFLGCEDPDAVTSLTLSVADVGAFDVDLLPVCRFAGVERITVIGRLLNQSVTSLYCFRKLRHLTIRGAEINVVRPSLVHASFRSRELRSVEMSGCGVERLESGVFDGMRTPSLKEVDLSANNLTKIVNATFVNLASLSTLNLSRNNIRHIAPHAFANVNIRYQIF